MTGERSGGHTAIVTGANHGIGAAVAATLAERGCAVLCTFLRVDEPSAPGLPEAYREHRVRDGATLVRRIRAGGGRAGDDIIGIVRNGRARSAALPPGR